MTLHGEWKYMQGIYKELGWKLSDGTLTLHILGSSNKNIRDCGQWHFCGRMVFVQCWFIRDDTLLNAILPDIANDVYRQIMQLVVGKERE